MLIWLLALGGFLGFVVGMYGLIWQGATPDGHFKGNAWWWLLGAVVCWIAWAVGMHVLPVPGP